MSCERGKKGSPTSVVASAITGVILLGVPLAFVGWYIVAIGSMAFDACIPRTGSCNYALGAWTLRGYPLLAGLLVVAFAVGIWSLRNRASPRRIASLALGAQLTLGALILIATALLTHATAR